MRVAELMTKDVGRCRVDDKLDVAAKLMFENDCGALPVLDEAGQRVVGMITDRDICMSAWQERAPLGGIEVSEAMSPTLYYCSVDDSVRSAEEIMRRNRIRRLPVVDDQRRLIGILSLADIAREVEREIGQPHKELVSDEVAATLATICAPPQNTAVHPRA